MVDATRERILDGAFAILSRDGADKLTIETVASFAGVSRKTIYNHFPGRFALIDGVVESIMDKTIEHLQTIAMDNKKAFIVKLNEIVEYGYSTMNKCGKIFTDQDRFREINGFRIGFTGQFYSLIENIVINAKNEGLIKEEYHERKLTFALINIVSGLSVLKGIEDEQFSKADILRLSLKAMVSGILTEKGIEAMKDSPILLFGEHYE